MTGVLFAVIVACEAGFWLLLLAGLCARYPLRRPRAGAALLLCVPLLDAVLLAATVVDLRGGTTAGFSHGLAAAYLGYSVAFGHGWTRWADARFAHRFAGGPPPPAKPRHGRARARYEWREFGKGALATAIGCAALLLMIALVGDPDRTGALIGWTVRLGVILAVWSLWPITYTLWPAKPGPGEASAAEAQAAPAAQSAQAAPTGADPGAAPGVRPPGGPVSRG